MLNRLPTPRETPPLSLLLDDIFQPAPAELARALGVDRADLEAWIAADDAPRPVMLALFWLTRWGMSRVDCEAVNAATLHAQQARGLADELARVRALLARLVQISDFGSANEPLWSGPDFELETWNALEVPIHRRQYQFGM